MQTSDPDLLAWTVIDGTAIFLDIDRDRYFRLPGDRNRIFLENQPLRKSRLPVQPSALPLRAAWLPPAKRSSLIDSGSFRLGDVSSAIWFQRRTERRLRSSSFSSVLLALSQTLQGAEGNSMPDTCGVARVISAFENARLIRTAADRCLPRSIAMALRLARLGCRADVVLGVKLSPFAAHCWAQCGDEVLNDSLEEVQRYTPILII